MEEWKAIAGWVGYYEVSNLGRVRSLARIAKDGRKVRGRILKPGGIKYLIVGLSNGQVTDAPVHRLVLEAFKGPCPPGLEGCHGDGDSKNNRLSNLRWDTRAANAADTTKHARRCPPRGEDTAAAKLTDCLVRKVRADTMLSNREWSRRLGVSHNVIGAVRNNTAWVHVV